MQITAERGSDKLAEKLFDRGSTEEELLALLGQKQTKAAGAATRIKNIWWYGQPAIDQIVATVHVDLGAAGSVIDAVLKLQNEALRVRTDIFPLGIPRPDVAEIELTLHRNLGH